MHRLAAHQRTAAERRLIQSARDLGASLDREMSSTIRVLSALARSERLERGDLAAFGAEVKRAAATQPWMSVLLLSPDGRQLVNTAAPLAPRSSEPASLWQVLAARQPVVGDLARGPRGRLAFPVRVPVIRAGHVRYVLTAVITPEALSEVVARQFSAREEWTRTLVDRTGRVAASGLAEVVEVAEVARLAEALERSADLLSQREQERNEHLARAEAARTEAEAANRAKDEFLAMLGHELRNPLGPIRNGIYLLRQMIAPNERVSRVQGMIDRQVVHMTRLVDELLDASRVTRGKVVLQTEELDLRDVARDVCEDFEPDLTRAEINLDLDLPAAPVPVLGDRTRLAQTLGNLLHNAAKFTPAGGRVSVRLAADEEMATLTVRDDGCGIAPEVLPTLFQPFSQGPQPLDRSRGGLGLGLALVKGLVELHGGTVQASSDGPGRGTELRIDLPVAAPAEIRKIS